jgi:hypothetical protein
MTAMIKLEGVLNSGRITKSEFEKFTKGQYTFRGDVAWGGNGVLLTRHDRKNVVLEVHYIEENEDGDLVSTGVQTTYILRLIDDPAFSVYYMAEGQWVLAQKVSDIPPGYGVSIKIVDSDGFDQQTYLD